MSDEPTPSQSPPRQGRRSSFAGQTFADLFSSGRPSVNRGSTAETSQSVPAQPVPAPPSGPISQAAAQAQQRRLSLTTLGLSGSPSQSSPFNTFRRNRGDSIGSSSNSASIDESAIAEDDTSARDPNNGGSPSNTPFQRRTSFGARALRDIRTGSFTGQGGGGGGAPGSPGQNGTKSPPSTSANTSASKAHTQNGTISSRDAKGRGSSEGFNWSENLRTRAERTSIAGQGGLMPGSGSPPSHPRAKSVAVMEPPPVAPPKPKEKPRPDHFQERILKGDFYMD